MVAGMMTAGLPFACKARVNTSRSKIPAVPSVEAITSGAKQHWFGYYDKWQIDTTGRYALGGEVETFFRSPTPQDIFKVGLIDLENGNSWKEIGRSTSWGWQQGCMLQWVPGSDSEVIWNDHGDDGFIVYRILFSITISETRYARE